MAFEIPEYYEGFSRDVKIKFRSLVLNRIIDSIDLSNFDAWWINFTTDEERYFAAQLLSAAIIRTQQMHKSSYRQIVEVILPDLLRKVDAWQFRCLEDFESSLSNRTLPASVRFMPVDGAKIDKRPGNSGDTVIRSFGLSAGTHDDYLLRADENDSWTNLPRLLVFIDDLLGTGTQFSNFANAYRIEQIPDQTLCVYVPLLATTQGMQSITEKFPRVEIRPVEILTRSAGFFSGLDEQPEVWARDRKNTVEEVKRFYRDMMTKREIGPESHYTLELSVLLNERSPNNSLKAYWTTQGRWHPLLPR